ncbi:MAG: type II secretion system protein N, partial [Betaproteobacteria bacterium]
GALALLGLVLAYWSWAWFAPRPEARVPSLMQDTGAAVAPSQSARGLFGDAGQNANAGATTGSIKLLGIVAASGGRSGYAVLRLDARQTLAVLEGAEVESGLRLVEVHVDHVILERSGTRETLAWPARSAK